MFLLHTVTQLTTESQTYFEYKTLTSKTVIIIIVYNLYTALISIEY